MGYASNTFTIFVKAKSAQSARPKALRKAHQKYQDSLPYIYIINILPR